jgi:hypothetical protein
MGSWERETLFGRANFIWLRTRLCRGFYNVLVDKMERYSKLEEGHALLHAPLLVVVF